MMFSNELVCDILIYLKKDINKEITINELSTIFHYDKTYIMKRFKRELDISIFDYINSMRVYNSLPSYNYDNYIISIGFNNGFNSLEYYSEMFKKIIGVSPKTYKKFVEHDITVTEDQINIILNSINKLKQLDNRVNRYLNNRKPKTTMIKAIVFKK